MYLTTLKSGSLLLLVFSALVLGESHTHAGDHLPTGVTTLSTDTYTLAPLVQDTDTAYYSTDLGGPSQHTFDSIDESGSLNLLGSDNSSFQVSEEAITIGPETLRIVVKVTALDSNAAPEPWVDGSNTGEGYIAWRVDVGSTAGGSDPIEPGVPFTLQDSGFEVFNSAGTLTGSYDLTIDTSTETGLSGVAILGNNGQDIAGVDISSIHLFWEILTEDPDAVTTTTTTTSTTTTTIPTPPSPGTFYTPVTSCRVMDTRHWDRLGVDEEFLIPAQRAVTIHFSNENGDIPLQGGAASGCPDIPDDASAYVVTISAFTSDFSVFAGIGYATMVPYNLAGWTEDTGNSTPGASENLVYSFDNPPFAAVASLTFDQSINLISNTTTVQACRGCTWHGLLFANNEANITVDVVGYYRSNP